LYKGKMYSAYKFLNISSQVKRVKYSGETVYNVLMENYGTMSVNNLICETLHPDNLIAKIYRNRFTDDYNERVIYIMNDSLEKRKYYEYKSIINRIHSATF
jgi:sulfur relay (sulfurtransferase) DsrF/TusC family protein